MYLLADSQWTPEAVMQLLLTLSSVVVAVIAAMRGQTNTATTAAHGQSIDRIMATVNTLSTNLTKVSLNTPAPSQPAQTNAPIAIESPAAITLTPGLSAAPPLSQESIDAIGASLLKQMRSAQARAATPVAPAPGTLAPADRGQKP